MGNRTKYHTEQKQKARTGPFLSTNPSIWPVLLFTFFLTPTLFPHLLTIFFSWYYSNEMQDKHKSKLTKESYFFVFKRLQINITCFFCKKHLHKKNQAEIRFVIITVSCIKGSSEKNKYYKWKAFLEEKLL